MTLISAWLRWCASALRPLSSSLLLKLLWRPATPPRTLPPSSACVTSWRPLTRNSRAPGKRYLVRTEALPDRFHLDVYDLRTCISWRCVFRSQHERNAYLIALRTGDTYFWPWALLAHGSSPVRIPD